MEYGIVITRREPGLVAELAERAEQAGWDAIFSWETLAGLDPWTALAAAATRTSRLRLGTLLTPATKYTPWQLASVAQSVDLLSGGRVILSLGLGAVTSAWTAFEEDPGRRIRAARFSEALQILRGLWRDPSGFAFEGEHYRVRPPASWDIPLDLRPGHPVTTWCVGLAGSARSLRRAAACDGLLPNYPPPAGVTPPFTPDLATQAAVVQEIQGLRAELGLTGSYDVVAEDDVPLADWNLARERAAALAQAGFTWFVDSSWGHLGADDEVDVIKSRIDAGPPRPA